MGKMSEGERVKLMEGHVKKPYGHLLLCKQKGMGQEVKAGGRGRNSKREIPCQWDNAAPKDNGLFNINTNVRCGIPPMNCLSRNP